MSGCDQFGVSPEQRKIIEEKVNRRLFLRNEFLKQSSDPFRHASGEGGTVTGALEGQYALNNGQLLSLSEQNLVDCSFDYGNFGCDGGLMDFAFSYIKDNGIESEKNYPYVGYNDHCKFNKSLSILLVKDYVDINEKDENDLQNAIANIGPISVGIDATPKLQFYSSGYFYDEYCSSIYLNHGVLAVGYGNTSDKEYYIIKNSWGKMWGENGYMKLARNRNNHCGIATAASYPLI